MNTGIRISFADLVPSIQWQNEIMLRYFHSPPNSRARTQATYEIFLAFDAYLKCIARGVWRKYGGGRFRHGLADVESAAREGLLRAIQRWHPDRSKPIIYLASVWIAAASRAEAGRQSRGAIDLPKKVRRLCNAYRALRDDGKHSESESMLRSSASSASTCKIVRFLGQAPSLTPLSISLPLHSGNVLEGGDHADDLANSSTMQSIRGLLFSKCSSRERMIFYLVFPEVALSAEDVEALATKDGALLRATPGMAREINGNAQAIGRKLGVSGERIRQVLHGTLEKIRKYLLG